ncbi:MAG TPA: hypothetical protein VFL57_02265 [Bryobacteraceae bacterium]|nr:hypothetical protein [Bryobacteraceae bacterium]
MPAHAGLLFVSSFNAALYHASGKALIESFLQSGSEGTLLLCHEDGIGVAIRQCATLLTWNLDTSDLLASWIAANHDIIPLHLGGSATPCACPAIDAFRGHAPRCIWGWYNKNASRWFRKIVSLDYARTLPGYSMIVWLDSDCRFTRALTANTVAGWFGSTAVFYHKSRDRKVVESAVIGFRTTAAGQAFLDHTIERYRSGAFRSFARWDDGYQLQITIEEHPELPCTDLATHAVRGTHVLPTSPAGCYIEHDKGRHGRMRVMT